MKKQTSVFLLRKTLNFILFRGKKVIGVHAYEIMLAVTLQAQDTKWKREHVI